VTVGAFVVTGGALVVRVGALVVTAGALVVAVGLSVGQSVPRLVSPVPKEYDKPTEPTLTRGPHSPALPFTRLDVSPQHPSSATRGHERLKSGGGACQRVPCSHKYVTAVSSASSVGRTPSRLLSSTPLDVSPQHPSSATHGHEHHKRSACRRVRCSHSQCNAVSNPSSVGRLPSRLLVATALEVSPQHLPSATHMDTTISGVEEGACVNGRRGLTTPPSPSAVPAQSVACPRHC